MIPAGQPTKKDTLEPWARVGQIAMTPKVEFAGFHDIKIDESHRVLVPPISDNLAGRFAVIAGALIAASALTWIVISSLPSPFASAPVDRAHGSLAVSDTSDSRKGDRLPTPNTIIHGPGSAGSRHATETPPHTAAIRAKVRNYLEATVKLVPTPDTRPTTIEGWTLRDVTNGTAVLEGPNGTWRAARGDMVPGLGRVDSIFQWGNRLMVATSKGLISTP